MKYSTIKLIELVISITATAVLGIAINSPDGAMSVATRLIITIAALVILLVPLLYLDHLEGKSYPQWMNIWKLSWQAKAMMVAIAIVMIVIAFLSENHNGSWLILAVLSVRYISEYVNVRKYALNQLASVEELLQIHPEAQKCLRKSVAEDQEEQ